MSTEYTNRTVLLIPAALVGAANTWLGERLGSEAAATFGAPALGATVQGPATHAWCSWAMTDDDLEVARALCDDPRFSEVVLLAAAEVDPAEVLAMTGLVRVAPAESPRQ